nr:murein L,D-transpeptidase family protein [Ancylobacter koreensis]
MVLAGCNANDGVSPMSKANKSLSPQTLALIQQKGMEKSSPIVVRIFKEESELEVWKETTGGEYALLKTYPICRWSGELGPKVKEGDRQAPEGFYTITPGQMNPNSSYYLSFDLGFPNAYDRAWGRSGSNLMVHGDCSSRGCYAMTDEQVQEIFALGRESFFGGQRSFQVQAYPFRMTADNMVRHRNNPNLAFWKMLKEGSDVFELTKAPPQVGYCGKRYVFNATPVDPSQKLQASAPCPDYTQPEGLAEALAARQRETDTRIASAGALQPAAPIKTGKDGGMHKVFIAKLENPELSAPGSLPAVVKPPGSDYGVATNEPAPAESIALATADTVTEASAATGVPLPAPRPADAPGGPRTAVAAATPAPAAPSLFSFFGGGSSTPPTTAPAATAPGAAPATPPPAPATQVASLDSGGFFDGLKNLFGGSTPPAPTPTTQATAPGADAAAEVPVPPVRQAPAPAPSARPAASAATAPAPRANPAPAPQASTARPAAPTSASAPPPSAGVVPRQTHPGYGTSTSTAATPPAAATGTNGAGPALRPSVTSQNEAIYGTQALPGATILTPGSFSSSVQ